MKRIFGFEETAGESVAVTKPLNKIETPHMIHLKTCCRIQMRLRRVFPQRVILHFLSQKNFGVNIHIEVVVGVTTLPEHQKNQDKADNQQ